MCGIAGIVGRSQVESILLESILNKEHWVRSDSTPAQLALAAQEG
jgi:glucosamine 6-phosphate synthetase-like amidotransferase/phosphosugar isomerase protein